jgi:hypothetical protein
MFTPQINLISGLWVIVKGLPVCKAVSIGKICEMVERIGLY